MDKNTIISIEGIAYAGRDDQGFPVIIGLARNGKLYYWNAATGSWQLYLANND